VLKQIISYETYLKKKMVNTLGTSRGWSSSGTIEHLFHVEKNYDMLMKRILSRDILNALKRLERNGGSYGVDRMSTQNLRLYIVEHWAELSNSVQQGTMNLNPSVVSKSRNQQGLLGIPIVLDLHSTSDCPNLNPHFDP
jgi:hypothetical protein